MARRHSSRKRGCRSREVKPNAEDAPQTGDVSQREQKHKLLDSPHLEKLAELTGKTDYQDRADLVEFLFRLTGRPRDLALEEVFALAKQESNAAEAAGFSEICTAAKSLLATIAGLSAGSKKGLQDVLDYVANDAPELGNIRRHLEILSEAADLAAVRLDPPTPKRKGRPSQFDLGLLVFALANAYEAFSGRKFTYFRTKKASVHQPIEYEAISKGHRFVSLSVEFFRETLILPKRLFPAATPRAIATECERAARSLKETFGIASLASGMASDRPRKSPKK